MIKRICRFCKAHFEVYPSAIKVGRGKSCSRLCANRFLGQKHKGVPRPDDIRMRISESSKGKIVSLEARKNLSKAHKGQKHSLEQRQIMSTIMSGVNNPFYSKEHTTETKETMSASHKRAWQDQKYRAKQVQIALELWRNPNYVAKMMKARSTKPTKPERKLKNILDRNLPEFQYNGDGRLGIMIGGQIPDFPNVNGEKLLIEVFGDYYHSTEVVGDAWRRSELGKIMVYNSLGWKCLVIWEHELEELTEEEVVNKIRCFRKESRERKS